MIKVVGAKVPTQGPKSIFKEAKVLAQVPENRILDTHIPKRSYFESMSP